MSKPRLYIERGWGKYSLQLSLVDTSGTIHRPQLYILDNSLPAIWQRLKRSPTGHWSAGFGRIMFTTM